MFPIFEQSYHRFKEPLETTQFIRVVLKHFKFRIKTRDLYQIVRQFGEITFSLKSGRSNRSLDGGRLGQ